MFLKGSLDLGPRRSFLGSILRPVSTYSAFDFCSGFELFGGMLAAHVRYFEVRLVFLGFSFGFFVV